MRSLGIFAVAILLGGCSRESAVTPAERAAAERWIRLDQIPDTAKPIALWHANDIQESVLCGEIEPSPALRDRYRTLRYVFDPNGKQPSGQVELHDGWVTSSPVSASILEENRRVFAELWSTHCAPYAPWSRKVAASTGLDFGFLRQTPSERTADDIIEEMKARNRHVDELAKRLGAKR